MFLKGKLVRVTLIKNKYGMIKMINNILNFLGRKYEYSLRFKLMVLLADVYGISFKRYIKVIASFFKFSVNIKMLYLSILVYQKLQFFIRKLRLNYDLQKYIRSRIQFKNRLNLYSSIRYRNRLPTRGQRSKTNAGTSKSRFSKKNLDNNKRKKN